MTGRGQNMPALLSVVIPTYQRPATLERAIGSALMAAPDGDVEVVVIPNGSDDSWKPVADRHRSDRRVVWAHLPTASASAARNHGLAIARGKYVRFLDDDDYLYPAAAQQLELLEGSRAEVSTAPLEIITQFGQRGGVIPLLGSADYVSAVLFAIGSLSLTQGSVFLRDAIGATRWRESAVLYDDYLWTVDLAGHREWVWVKMDQPVATYVQHFGSRLSYARRSSTSSREVVNALFDLHAHLSTSCRNSAERTAAVASALLTHAHSAFPACPAYLSGVIRQARRLEGGAMPLHALFRGHRIHTATLLALEWAMLPPRYVSRSLRRVFWQPGNLFNK